MDNNFSTLENNGVTTNSASPGTPVKGKKAFNKKRVIIAAVLVILYSAALVFATVKIDRKVLANQMQDAVAEAFGIDPDTLDENTDDSSQDGENRVADSLDAKAQPVNFGETFSNEILEIVIDSASTMQEIKPSDTSGVYSYISDVPNETFFFLTGSAKNLSGEDYDVTEMQIDFCFDDAYNYSGNIVIDEGGDDFYNDNIKPLKTVKYYMYASVPDEMVDSYTTCSVQFSVKGNVYEINLTK